MPPQKKKPAPGQQQPPNDDENVEDEGGDDEKPLTRGEIAKMINSAVSGQLGRKLQPMIEQAMAPILEKIKPPAREEDGDDGDDANDEDASPGKKRKPDPYLAKVLKQNERFQKELEQERTARAKEAEARKSATIESHLTEALTKLGVDPLRMRGALAVHKASAFVDDTTQKVRYKVARDGYDEDVDVAAALKDWAGSDEGKSYLAATGATGGSGARGPGAPGPSRKPAPNTPEGKAQRTQEAQANLVSGVAALLGGGSIPLE